MISKDCLVRDWDERDLRQPASMSLRFQFTTIAEMRSWSDSCRVRLSAAERFNCCIIRSSTKRYIGLWHQREICFEANESDGTRAFPRLLRPRASASATWRQLR